MRWPPHEKPGWFSVSSGGFLIFAVSDARRADADTLGRAFHQRANRLHIHVPAPVSHVVRVADLMPELRTLAANFTNSCHYGEHS
jgi:hypothetical protein